MEIDQEKILNHLNELEKEYGVAKRAAAQVPELKNALKKATQSVTQLQAQLNEQKEASKCPFSDEDLTKVADILENRNVLAGENKVAFIERVREHPEELVEVFEKVAGFSRATEPGEADPDSVDTNPEMADPIVRWAFS